MIDALPPADRRARTTAVRRDFNVGVELAPGVRRVELAIEPAAARRVVALGGRIVVTAKPQVTSLVPAAR